MRKVLFSWNGRNVYNYPAMLYLGMVAGVFAGAYVAQLSDMDPNAFAVASVALTQATGAAVVFETTNHLVATYDGTNLILYLNGEQSSPTTPADYHPATANALYIGAGRPDLPDPRFPFVGKVQCVTLYKGALTLDDILRHYHNGNGIDP